MTDNDKREDILMFLEDHISKLVKLKVASRAKYKEYDQLYIDYITAMNIEDHERMKLYGEMMEFCHASMLSKLKKAITDHPELLLEDVVAEYLRLMD